MIGLGVTLDSIYKGIECILKKANNIVRMIGVVGTVLVVVAIVTAAPAPNQNAGIATNGNVDVSGDRNGLHLATNGTLGVELPLLGISVEDEAKLDAEDNVAKNLGRVARGSDSVGTEQEGSDSESNEETGEESDVNAAPVKRQADDVETVDDDSDDDDDDDDDLAETADEIVGDANAAVVKRDVVDPSDDDTVDDDDDDDEDDEGEAETESEAAANPTIVKRQVAETDNAPDASDNSDSVSSEDDSAASDENTEVVANAASPSEATDVVADPASRKKRDSNTSTSQLVLEKLANIVETVQQSPELQEIHNAVAASEASAPASAPVV